MPKPPGEAAPAPMPAGRGGPRASAAPSRRAKPSGLPGRALSLRCAVVVEEKKWPPSPRSHYHVAPHLLLPRNPAYPAADRGRRTVHPSLSPRFFGCIQSSCTELLVLEDNQGLKPLNDRVLIKDEYIAHPEELGQQELDELVFVRAAKCLAGLTCALCSESKDISSCL